MDHPTVPMMGLDTGEEKGLTLSDCRVTRAQVRGMFVDQGGHRHSNKEYGCRTQEYDLQPVGNRAGFLPRGRLNNNNCTQTAGVYFGDDLIFFGGDTQLQQQQTTHERVTPTLWPTKQ